MIIKDKIVNVYDIEVFPNVFHCTVKDTEKKVLHKFEISERINQIEELVEYFLQSSRMFCGYNNHSYDDVIINYMIMFIDTMKKWPFFRLTDSLFRMSQDLISATDSDNIESIRKFKKWMYAHYFYSMDIIKMLFAKKLRVGLKSMQVTMHYPNVLEFDGDFNDHLPRNRIDEMINYNINDVESTATLLDSLKKDVELRLYIEKDTGIDCLSMNSVKLAEEYLGKACCEALHIDKNTLRQMKSPMDDICLNDVILPFIHYNHPILQRILNEMKNVTVNTHERKSYENKFYINNTLYSVGVGGIHSINTPKIYKPKDGEYIGHQDVASMYPSLLIEWNMGPKHLGEPFRALFAKIKEERLEAKHTGQTLKNKFLKIVLNSPTGKMQEETSWMYDPFDVFRIRINGQLILLMLVDRLLKFNCEIIQVNTDGVIFIAKEKDRNDIAKSIKELQSITRLVFEGDDYEAFYQYAINDYFGILKGFSKTHDPKLIEEKGLFITKTALGKGLAPVIIPKAVINYFTEGQPVDEYMRNHLDIKDYLISQRVAKQFKVSFNEKIIQRINRFYACSNGYYLYKIKPDNNNQHFNMLTKSSVWIVNDLSKANLQEHPINFKYYVSEANSIISSFVNQQLSLF